MRFARIVFAYLALCTGALAQVGQIPSWPPVQPAPAAGGLMLDGITTGVKACYSTRKLLTAYAGNAIQVQETSGNTTSNIGFSSNVLDTASLTTFCTGKTCKVITWFDQCGGGFNQTQGTIANAPIIYQSGAVNTLNGKPAILWVAANTTFLTNATLGTNPTNTLFMNAVLSTTVASGAQQIIGPGTSGRQAWDLNNLIPRITSALTAVIGSSTSTLTVSTGAIVEMQYEPVGGAWSQWVNRVAAGTGTQTSSFAASNGTFIGDEFGISGNANYWDGPIAEMVQYDLVGGIPSGSRTAIENNQSTYWGTP